MLGWWHAYVDAIEWSLRELTEFTGNVGVSIIIFTILLKTVLLPLTVKSVKSTAAMQELQPKIKELQKKYSKDRAKLTEETMRLYQEYQINPAAGCLPLLLQIPIFFGLYYAVTDISRGGGGFLWIDNLAAADPYKILPILAGIFQFIQMRMMRPADQPKVSDPQQQMMNTMMNFMPLMVVVFGWTFAAGAVLYWATQSVYSVVQQWFITGWGAMKRWFPWLDKMELPEHRRLGHRKPVEPREITGDVQPRGLMGYLQRQARQAEERRAQQTTRVEEVPEPAAQARGKRAKQARKPADARNIGGGAAETATAANAKGGTRVMMGPKAQSRRGRGGS